MITITQKLISLNCANCHMPFAIPDDFQTERERDHKSFYCPRGHKNFYPGKSDIEKLEERLAKAKGDSEYWQAEELIERRAKEATQRRLRATKGHVTRLRNKAVAGCCPRCDAEFPDLRDHIAEHHPGMVSTHEPEQEEGEG